MINSNQSDTSLGIWDFNKVISDCSNIGIVNKTTPNGRNYGLVTALFHYIPLYSVLDVQDKS